MIQNFTTKILFLVFGMFFIVSANSQNTNDETLNDTILLDLGDNLSPEPWNNLTKPDSGFIFNLKNVRGFSTNYNVIVLDAFNNINRTGTTTPSDSIGFPATATGDSFFGNVEDFGGQSQPTGVLDFWGLVPLKEYSFTIFASRTSATDNREAKYILSGEDTQTLYLNASSNTDMVVSGTVKANIDGSITLNCSPGPNNDNANHFYYIGAIKMIYEEDEILTPQLVLSSPNGGEVLYQGDIAEIQWQSANIDEIAIEYSYDNGENWQLIDSVEASQNYYEWLVPSIESNQCLVKLSGENVEDISNDVFTIKSVVVVDTLKTILLDLGDNLSPEPWNNLTDPVAGVIEDLMYSDGSLSGYSVSVTDDFNNINRAGTTNPDSSIDFPSTATADSFFGNVEDFSGQSQPTGQVDFNNLDPDKSYSFTIFASREATDNREAQYVLSGSTNDTLLLNASSNTSNVVTGTIKPDENGKIKIICSPGPNNNNSSHFYYFGALKVTFNPNEVAEAKYDTILLDLGDNLSELPWINLTDPQLGSISDIPNSKGLQSGYSISVTDAFNNINRVGTTTPDPSTDIPSTASADSFFGNIEDFGGQSQPEAQLDFGRLTIGKDYNISFFASRMDVTDNRETQYIISGETVDTLYLNVSNNTTLSVNTTIKPDSDGKITINCSPGPNNDNSYHFYYLGTIKMTYESEESGDPELTLLQPNGGETYQSNKIGKISWISKNIENIGIDYSLDNGNTWTEIDSVTALTGYYNWHIPANALSEYCKVRIGSGTISDISDDVFTITDVADDCRIVVLGSSTAEGTGASPIDSSWVNRYKSFLSENSAFEVVNLARGGYTTYHILPTGTVSPGISISVDTARNITKAVSLNPYAIIVNMPSNDAANNFPTSAQMNNFDIVYKEAEKYGILTWICTPQPRNFSSQSQIDIQTNTRDSVLAVYGEYALDFWNGIADDNGFILSEYNSGDGIHLNNAGHRILFEKVKSKQIDTLCPLFSVSNKELNIDQGMLNIYPNPNNGIFNIETENIEIIEMNFYNILGQQIKSNWSNLSSDNNKSNFIVKLIDFSNSDNQLLYCNMKISTKNGIKYITKPFMVTKS
ncbi:MAG: SGNH/GDSL hydrolase family protein [Saprospiraceae bacterium]